MLRILFYPITIIALALGTTELIPAVKWVISHPAKYQFVAIGMAAYIAITAIRVLNKNLEWMRTFSHELSHTIVGMMFLRKIHSFEAGVGTGVMSHSGGLRFGDTFISLAPYCLPIFTYLLLFLRELGAPSSLYIFDIMIGVTVAFHIGCFRRQTGRHQTDITGIGITRSYLFIITMWVINLAVLLLSIRMGVLDAFKSLALGSWDTLTDWYAEAVRLFKSYVANI